MGYNGNKNREGVLKKIECKICGEIDYDNFYLNFSKSLCKNHFREKYPHKVKKVLSEEQILEKKINNRLIIRLNSAKIHALKRGREFNISFDYLKYILKCQGYKCAYTDREFIIDDNNYTFSLDRIDSKKGYIEGNVQFVLAIINIMKWSLEENEFIGLCKEVYINSAQL